MDVAGKYLKVKLCFFSKFVPMPEKTNKMTQGNSCSLPPSPLTPKQKEALWTRKLRANRKERIFCMVWSCWKMSYKYITYWNTFTWAGRGRYIHFLACFLLPKIHCSFVGFSVFSPAHRPLYFCKISHCKFHFSSHNHYYDDRVTEEKVCLFSKGKWWKGDRKRAKREFFLCIS